MNKKPLALKITVLLLCLYGIINLISNYINAYYVHVSCGFFCFSVPIGFNSFTIIAFIFIIVPVIPLFIAAQLLWKWRGKKLGYWVSIALLVLGFLPAVSGMGYLVANLPKLFTEDLLYLTKNPPPGMNWILDNSVEHYASVDSLIVFRILIIKSLLKSVIEVVTIGLLFIMVISSKYFE